ncbi:unnamed protein product [Amaranthus hypochondriacus]
MPTTWAKTQPYGHEHKTISQFYFHDVVSGNDPTSVPIAQPISTNASNSPFGRLAIADEPLTISPDPNSKLVGRAQGIMGMASKEEPSLMMSLTYGFVDGIYNGSSIVVLGRNSIMNPIREMPVVGGTGLFRMARGYAIARTYSASSTTFNAIVGYNITIFHPSTLFNDND